SSVLASASPKHAHQPISPEQATLLLSAMDPHATPSRHHKLRLRVSSGEGNSEESAIPSPVLSPMTANVAVASFSTAASAAAVAANSTVSPPKAHAPTSPA